jgi:hypothetical protein
MNFMVSTGRSDRIKTDDFDLDPHDLGNLHVAKF